MQRSLKALTFCGATLCASTVDALGRMWGDVKPNSYKYYDKLDIEVGKLWSRVEGALPYDFYSLNWCDADKSQNNKDTIAYNPARIQSLEMSNDDVHDDLHHTDMYY